MNNLGWNSDGTGHFGTGLVVHDVPDQFSTRAEDISDPCAERNCPTTWTELSPVCHKFVFYQNIWMDPAGFGIFDVSYVVL